MKPLPHDSGQDGLGISYSCQFCASSSKQLPALRGGVCFLKGLNMFFCPAVEARRFADSISRRIYLLMKGLDKET